MLGLITHHLKCTRQKAIESLVQAGAYYILQGLDDTLCIIDHTNVNTVTWAAAQLTDNPKFVTLIRRFVSNTRAVTLEDLKMGRVAPEPDQASAERAGGKTQPTSDKRKRARTPTAEDMAAWHRRQRAKREGEPRGG